MSRGRRVILPADAALADAAPMTPSRPPSPDAEGLPGPAERGRQLELAAQAAGIAFWSRAAGAERAHWNALMRRIHALADDEPVPTREEWIERFVHPEDRAAMRQRIAARRHGAEGDGTEVRVLRRDGEVRHLILHTCAEPQAAGLLEYGVVIDVTERRRVDLALREASERAALAARGAGLGTWEMDLRDLSARWDEQMWRLRGLVPAPTPPDSATRMAMVHPDDRAAVYQQLEMAITDDVPVSYEFRVVLPDGRVRWLASRSVPVHDEHGRAVRRIGVNWDVTDSRTAEAVRQEREIALRESQAKSKFLARMSHELRTPLNGVLGFAQLLLAEDDGTDPAAAGRRRRVEQIRAAGEHLLSLINDVLDLSSLEGGEMRITLQPVALAPLVAATIPLLEAPMRARGITLDTGPLDVVALADATRLRQVLLNLLSNAVKYNRDGGRIRLEAARTTTGVLVRVADTGRGMNDEQLRHLFEPFNRLGIEREGIEGTGIGLAIVKALVERMGGSVHVDSTPGAGSVFELRLADAALEPAQEPPLQPAGAPAPAAPAAGAAGPLRGQLLYVEDNPVNALIIQELVARRADLALHVAPDGASGVRLARDLLPDLVLLDMHLPDFDGHEVLRRLRADPATAKIPVIALSANAMPDAIERALRAGMADYWTKPLDFGAFLASLDTLFGPAPR